MPPVDWWPKRTCLDQNLTTLCEKMIAPSKTFSTRENGISQRLLKPLSPRLFLKKQSIALALGKVKIMNKLNIAALIFVPFLKSRISIYLNNLLRFAPGSLYDRF